MIKKLGDSLLQKINKMNEYGGNIDEAVRGDPHTPHAERVKKSVTQILAARFSVSKSVLLNFPRSVPQTASLEFLRCQKALESAVAILETQFENVEKCKAEVLQLQYGKLTDEQLRPFPTCNIL